METMSPQQESIGQSRSASLTGESKIPLPDGKKKMKTLAQRRQSAPSLVISKALTKTRTISRDSCLSPISPEACPLVQSFLNPSRKFIAHGRAHLKTGLQTQERHLFLFNDIFLITKAKSTLHFKLKAQVRVSEMWTAGCMEEVCEGSTSPERSFVMGWPTSNCVATFSSVEQKERWWCFIKSVIKEEKEKEDPKTVSLTIYAKDIGNCAHPKTLVVGNFDCATDVIRMALQQFGILASVKDYQLWVGSSKDAAPYPLIGHEVPFSIIMSHIREPLPQTGCGNESILPPGLQGALLIQHPPIGMQCQFVLKPCRMATRQSLIEPGPKPFKRKRSFINWAFWRGSASQLDSLPLSPTSPAPGQIFGLPLSTVCRDNTLPKPVMDMLEILFNEGPFTRGIFRRSASAKACRELKDRLNSMAEDVQLTQESIFVIAAVFKEFLRNIPGSLLFQDLYSQWLGVLDLAGEREKQLHAVQRLLQQLPIENLLLIRHVLAVLHCICRHSNSNQMNSFNLSVCIAPSMLWAPPSCSPEKEGEGTKKISEVVRFLIQNFCNILGEDVCALFGGLPQRHGSNDQGSDVSSFQMNDSSYDSLENELNDDAESPIHDRNQGKDKQDNWSRDSVITMSDCDLDQLDQKPDPESHLLQLPPFIRPRKLTPSLHQPRPGPYRGDRQLRRSSEPAISFTPSSVSTHLKEPQATVCKSSYDGKAIGSEEDSLAGSLHGLRLERLTDPAKSEGIIGTLGIPVQRHRKPPPLCLDASCSSFSSPATSPSASSVSSLDSAFSQYSMDYSVTPGNLCSGTSRVQGNASPRNPGSGSFALSFPGITSPTFLDYASTTVSSEWSFHRAAQSMHPKNWLKRGRRLSLVQQDRTNIENDKERNLSNGPHPSHDFTRSPSFWTEGSKSKGQESRILSMRRSSCPPSYQEAVLQIQLSKGPFDKAKDMGLIVKEQKQLLDQASLYRSSAALTGTGSDINHTAAGRDLSQAVIYGQRTFSSTICGQTSLSLATAPERSVFPRRASEPTVVQSADCQRLRLWSQSTEVSLKLSDVDLLSDGASLQHGFCMLPLATSAKKNNFFFQADPSTSREMTVTVIQGQKPSQGRRCSNPRFDDFEQMFFAEESCV